jgi:hypothetical protein
VLTKSWRQTWAGIGCCGILAVSARPSSAADVSPVGVCLREGAKVAGTTPVKIDQRTPAPRKIRHVAPSFPADAIGSGPWAGEFLVGTDGKVLAVWTTLRSEAVFAIPDLQPIHVDAIRRWEFTPVILKGKPTAACTTVTIMINWS